VSAEASDLTPGTRSPRPLCLITGATGFIGGHLATRLLREGYAVRCLVRASSDTADLDGLDVELAVGELTSLRSLAPATEGCHFVVHCAALVSDWATTEEIAAINVDGTRRLLEASVKAGVNRFIHFSSTDVYGYPGGGKLDETYAATRFRNWYAQTKLQAEAEVRSAERTGGLDVVILRPATVYGPGSTAVIGEIARAMCEGHMLLVARGQAIAGLCYVENLMDAALLALTHGSAVGQAFNVTDALDVTWRQFTDDLGEGLGCAKVRWSVPYWMAYGLAFALEHGYRLLRRSTGLHAKPLLSRQAVQVLGLDQDFSNAKLQQMLGWEPRVDYASGLDATLAWLKRELLAPG
jgi:nucleoside-diphosphate-sugar epimerase